MRPWGRGASLTLARKDWELRDDPPAAGAARPLRSSSQRPKEVIMLTARDVMTKDILTADADWTLSELASFLDGKNITGAPVCDNGVMIGLVSATDLARAWQNRVSLTAPQDVLREAGNAGVDATEMSGFGVESDSALRVRDVMTPVVFTVEEETLLAEVADMMIRGHIHRVVVARGKKPVGIISALDLLRVFRATAGALEVEAARAEAVV